MPVPSYRDHQLDHFHVQAGSWAIAVVTCECRARLVGKPDEDYLTVWRRHLDEMTAADEDAEALPRVREALLRLRRRLT